MSSTFRPTSASETRDVVAWCADSGSALEVIGSGSKRGLGRPLQTEHTLDLSGLAGIGLYEPEELVMSAAPATPIGVIERALDDAGQMLAFEPLDPGPLLGAGGGTVGGVFACNLSGPRRIKAGAARDHLLGFSAVSGRGECFRSGGRVVKNVTGYDLSKLVCGSWGTLAVVTELTFKVLPAPERTWTVLVSGLDGRTATGAMSAAMRSPHEVAGAAHLPRRAAASSSVEGVSGAGGAITALRLEGFGPSVEQNCRELRELLENCGETCVLRSQESRAFWREVRDAAVLPCPDNHVIWRISVAPSSGHLLLGRLTDRLDHGAFLDWAGGLVWLSTPPDGDCGASVIRAAVAGLGGHATLFRAPAAIRSSVPVFQPQPAPLAALSRRIKESFDPRGILNPGKMVTGV